MTENSDLKKSKEVAYPLNEPEQTNRENVGYFRKTGSGCLQEGNEHSHEVAEELKRVKQENNNLRSKIKKL
jgi:hypothetical protein